MKILAKIAITATLAGMILAFFPAAAHADTDDFHFSDFNIQYQLSKSSDGTSQLDVVENLTAEFPNYDQNHGINRIIPITNQNNKNIVFSDYRIGALRNGKPENIARTIKKPTYYDIYLGSASDYVHGTQRYTLSYTFNHVITDFGDYQELYWDTNGTGWSQSINRLSATVYLDELADKFIGEAWCYVGVQGSDNQSDCSIEYGTNIVTFTANRALDAYENLTLVMKFKPGSFVVPAPPDNYIVLALGILQIAVTLSVMIIAIFLIRPKYMDTVKKYKNKFIPVQYLPPADLVAGEANAAYISHKTKNAIPVEIIELAVKRKIQLHQIAPKGRFGKTTYTVHVLDANLSDIELLALQALQGSGDITSGTIINITSSYDTAKSTALKSYNSHIKTALTTKGYLAKTNLKGTTPITAILFFGIAIISTLFAFMVSAIPDGLVGVNAIGGIILLPMWLLLLTSWVIAILLVAEANKYENITETGLELNNYLKGLKLYLQLAESDRIKLLQSPDTAEKIDVNNREQIVRLYEKLLPYAMVFGIEKEWSKQLETYYGNDAPTWYVGGISGFSAASFSSSMSSMSSSISSSVSSSTSSGSGGGGSSGGGGGGGGGGGW